MQYRPSCKRWRLFDGQIVGSDEVMLGTFLRGEQLAVETLSPGWSPVSVWQVQNQLNILVLKHLDNNKAFWYFGADGRFLGNMVAGIWGLGPWVREAFGSLLKRLLLESVDPNQFEASLISEAIEPLSYEMSALANDIFSTAKDLTGDLESPEGRILNAPPSDVQDEVLQHVWGGINVEVRGRPLKAKRGLVLNDFIFAYPLFDGQTLSAFIFVGFQSGIRVGYLDMLSMELFYQRPPGGIVSAKLLIDLIVHIRVQWKALRDYFGRSEPLAIFGVTRANHIGHRYWNELSGLHRIRQSGFAKNLGAIIHFDPQNTGELWLGAREVLNRPELELFFSKDNKTMADLIYRFGAFPLRIGDFFIPQSLANLVSSHCQTHAEVNVPDKVPGELRIVFGLRFENRTWVNQIDGLAEIACHLAEQVSTLTIIVDGHDRLQGVKVLSHCESLASDTIIAQEKRVVHAVKTALAKHGHACVTVIDAVDIELASTMAWILSADCFVAPWGAGLAKYKWGANLDGVIFSSPMVIEHKADLKIYEDPKIREGATECIYLPVQYVSDAPDAIELINISGGGMRENFVVDMSGLKASVDKLISQVKRGSQ